MWKIRNEFGQAESVLDNISRPIVIPRVIAIHIPGNFALNIGSSNPAFLGLYSESD